MAIKRKQWLWHGLAAHFVGGDMCRFHMATEIGNFLVSTVGDMRTPESPNKAEEIGMNRTYETMVFKTAIGRCECGCGLPRFEPDEIDFAFYNDAVSARDGHMEMCEKYGKLASWESKKSKRPKVPVAGHIADLLDMRPEPLSGFLTADDTYSEGGDWCGTRRIMEKIVNERKK